MENVIINDFNRLIDELNKLTKNDSIFRGYSHEDEMFPNILRRENLPSEEIMLIYERKLLEKFEKYALSYVSPNNAIDFLSCAQHYGLPTRLLDFTYNPFIALFFSLYNEKIDGDYYSICVCNKENYQIMSNFDSPSRYDYYKIKKGKSTLDYVKEMSFSCKIQNIFLKWRGTQLNKIRAFEPNFSNIRITMQQGLFVVPSRLTKENFNNTLKTCTYKLLIHKGMRDEALIFLDKLGFNSFKLMPDLASVCSSIKNNSDKLLNEVIKEEDETINTGNGVNL